ncbi:MAG: DUF5320 domain-containing protein [Deltaproteobacteria bacterium]|nr:DUF5320 domain-containing protein [Deltaproteobacteria bacterium]
MPGFNRTGPMGEGPMTGGGRGYCTGADSGFQPNYGRQGSGRGQGGGRGRGYGGGGFRRAGGNPAGNAPQYNAPDNVNRADELGMLKAQAAEIKSALDNIQRRMAELDKTTVT